MLKLEDRVKQLFSASIELQISLADAMTPAISKAGSRLVDCLLNNGKIFLCGNGGSMANCMHFSAAMLNRFEAERPPLPVIVLSTDLSMLTSVSSDGHHDQIFARQILAFGKENDVLLALTTTGNSKTLLSAIEASNETGVDVIVLSAHDGGMLASHLGPEDIELRVPGNNAARIRETHLFILHCFCDLIEQALFGQILG